MADPIDRCEDDDELLMSERSPDVLPRPFLRAFDVGEPEPSTERIHLPAIRTRDTGEPIIEVAQGGLLRVAVHGDALRDFAAPS